LEEIMHKQYSRAKIAISFAALTFGAAMAAAPALAQQLGKPANDGGLVQEPSTPASRPVYNSVPQQAATPHYGRPVNDGGIVDEPSAAAAQATHSNQTNAIQTPPHYGRPLNDGGM
jgi:hypothetical protein